MKPADRDPLDLAAVIRERERADDLDAANGRRVLDAARAYLAAADRLVDAVGADMLPAQLDYDNARHDLVHAAGWPCSCADLHPSNGPRIKDTPPL